jgi:hypothetical protein
MSTNNHFENGDISHFHLAGKCPCKGHNIKIHFISWKSQLMAENFNGRSGRLTLSAA